jgi:antitoxin component of RelBE/YafQ-DinJ toxin-antitoxin module
VQQLAGPQVTVSLSLTPDQLVTLCTQHQALDESNSIPVPMEIHNHEHLQRVRETDHKGVPSSFAQLQRKGSTAFPRPISPEQDMSPQEHMSLPAKDEDINLPLQVNEHLNHPDRSGEHAREATLLIHPVPEDDPEL